MRLSTPIRIVAGALLAAALSGCGKFGEVNQGQVIEYRRAEGLITLISDSNYRDPDHPRFDILPPVTIRIPQDPGEMGAEPDAGSLLSLDSRSRRAVFFDSTAQTFRTVEVIILSEQSGVRPSDARMTNARLPAVDRVRKTITTYLPRERKLIAFAVPEPYYNLPDEAWKVGDEIRYYYKDPGRALRLMNVTRTDLDKAGK